MIDDLKTAAIVVAFLLSLYSVFMIVFRLGGFSSSLTGKVDSLDKRHGVLAEETRTGLVKLNEKVSNHDRDVAVLQVEVKHAAKSIDELRHESSGPFARSPGTRG